MKLRHPSLMPSRGAARALAAGALALVLLASASASATAAVPPSFVGLQGWEMPSGDHFQRIGQANVGYFRTNVNWSEVERNPGAYEWGSTDELFRRAAAGGVRVLPVMIASPGWAASRPQWPPSSESGRAAYARWVGAAVRRYGPGGTFWSEHPGLNAALAPVHWQIWNEPNLGNYWHNRPNPAQYGALLRAANGAAKQAYGGVKIVAAGLPESPKGMKMATYLDRLERSRSTRRSFDVVAVHPYARDHRGVLAVLDRARAVLRRHRDARKPMWITEAGWATGPRPDSRGFVTSERGQASRLANLYSMLWKKRKKYRLIGAVWFSYRDPSVRPSDWWAVHTGLLGPDGAAKPAWKALLRITGGNDVRP